jgi:hypothetical protein
MINENNNKNTKAIEEKWNELYKIKMPNFVKEAFEKSLPKKWNEA